MKKWKLRSSLLANTCRQTYSCWKTTCYDASSPHYQCESKFSLPVPAAHQTTENIAKKCVMLKQQQRSSEAVLNMQFPSLPFCNCYTEFILKCYLLPCLQLDCFSRGVCFHPYYCGSRYMCHAVDTTQMSKTCHEGLFQNILFWKWDKV